jgi:hypothetical protein
MMVWRALSLILAALTGGALPAAGATGENADWPCAQRLVPEIAPGMIWAGPPLDSVGGKPDAALDKLAGELAARRVPLEEAEAQVAKFADKLGKEDKDERLTRLFARTLEIINHDRSSIIRGIEKYARAQRALAETITEKNERLSELPKEEVVARDALAAERDWDIRIYDDRERSLTYLCEQPVLLEQRAFALARAIASHLE